MLGPDCANVPKLRFPHYIQGLSSQKTHVSTVCSDCPECVGLAQAPDVWRREGPVGGVRSLTPRGTAAR